MFKKMSYIEIKNECEGFIGTWKQKYDFPYDLDLIIEKELGFDVVPYSGFKALTGTDAVLLYNKKEILYDERVTPLRIRFSMAHEIGHYILHQSILQSISFTSLEEYFDYFQNIPLYEYRRYERQADLFAGILIMPEVLLFNDINSFKNSLDSDDQLKIENMNYEEISDFLGAKLAKSYSVSDIAMATRLKIIYEEVRAF